MFWGNFSQRNWSSDRKNSMPTFKALKKLAIPSQFEANGKLHLMYLRSNRWSEKKKSFEFLDIQKTTPNENKSL